MTKSGDRRRQAKAERKELWLQNERTNYDGVLLSKIEKFGSSIAWVMSRENEKESQGISRIYTMERRDSPDWVFGELAQEFAQGVNFGVFTREHALGRLASLAQIGAESTKARYQHLGAWFETQVSVLNVALSGELPAGTMPAGTPPEQASTPSA